MSFTAFGSMSDGVANGAFSREISSAELDIYFPFHRPRLINMLTNRFIVHSCDHKLHDGSQIGSAC